VTFTKFKAFSVTAARAIPFVNSDQNSKFPKTLCTFSPKSRDSIHEYHGHEACYRITAR